MTRVYSKNAPLVSSSFLFPSHKQLFSRVTLGSDRTCQRIHQFLVQNPVIQFFIITGKGTGSTNPEWTNGASLLSFRCLEDFLIIVRRDVWNYRNWNWNLFNSELKDALSNIIHSYTLKTLSLADITEVPITFFLHIVYLSKFGVTFPFAEPFWWRELRVTLANMGTFEGSGTNDWPVCVCVAFQGGTCAHQPRPCTIICLLFLANFRTFKGPLTWSRNSCAVYAPLKSTFTSIPQPYMTFISCPWWVHCNISLTSPATLEHLVFNIRFRDYINHFNSYRFYDNLRDADVWSIWTLSPLIHPGHGYELTSTSITPLGTTIIGKN